MNALAIFGISAALSFASSVVAAKLYVWPWLRKRGCHEALASLTAPHLFLRFIGLSVLVTGVVSPALPKAFAIPVAYGDLVAGILAIFATIALAKKRSWAVGTAWVFNIWGTADFLYAFYEGPHAEIQPGMLGAAFYLITAIVPILLVTHFLSFGVLLRVRAS
ncbi:MAG TPA: hypothetical protein VJR23_17015 [Candidatus Acidoferrales bacterium]|nr:hypothetical protein [Candidatus Acidoferrales bacterium]